MKHYKRKPRPPLFECPTCGGEIAYYECSERRAFYSLSSTGYWDQRCRKPVRDDLQNVIVSGYMCLACDQEFAAVAPVIEPLAARR